MAYRECELAGCDDQDEPWVIAGRKTALQRPKCELARNASPKNAAVVVEVDDTPLTRAAVVGVTWSPYEAPRAVSQQNRQIVVLDVRYSGQALAGGKFTRNFGWKREARLVRPLNRPWVAVE